MRPGRGDSTCQFAIAGWIPKEWKIHLIRILNLSVAQCIQIHFPAGWQAFLQHRSGLTRGMKAYANRSIILLEHS